MKIEGTYHGHHDAGMVSVKPLPSEMGDRSAPASVPYGEGSGGADRAHPSGPVHDAEALERLFGEIDVAGLIMEPA